MWKSGRLLLFLAVPAVVGPATWSQPVEAIIGRDSRHDVSALLRTQEPIVGAHRKKHGGATHAESAATLPSVRGSRAGKRFSLNPAGLALESNFEGIDQRHSTQGNAAPDPNGAAGKTQYVQAVNAAFAVFDKSDGSVLLGPAPLVDIWSGFESVCGSRNDGDPIVQYDKVADRWVLTHRAAPEGGPYYQCFAISTGPDATGTYFRYAFQLPNLFPDYPKMGVWPDAYYLSFDELDARNKYRFAGALACAFERAAMLRGAAAIFVCFPVNPSAGRRLLPADLDICNACPGGSSAPSVGEAETFMNLGVNTLNVWKFHVDFQAPNQSRFEGPQSLAVRPFTPTCPTRDNACIPQVGTTQLLDSLSGGLMYRLPYRKFTGGPEVLLALHTVEPGAALRWYEIRDLNAPRIFQEGTFAPDSSYRWNGSIAMDKQGDIAMGYSVSGSAIHPAIRSTGRAPSDPPGMAAEVSILEGTGSRANSNHWGDYTSLSIDPTDDCTFWYTNEYVSAEGGNAWHTRIASFRFPSCS